MEVTEKLAARREVTRIAITYGAGHFHFENVTLISPADDAPVLVKNLNLRLDPGSLVRICGSNRAGRTALFRAAAGLHECGTGSIERPPADQVAFLPEQPYLPPGTLRELLVPAGASEEITDAQIQELLGKLGLGSLLKPNERTDVPRNWQDSLSLQEEKLLAIARTLLAKPRFAFIDELESALNDADRRRVLDLLDASGITCVLFGSPTDGTCSGACLELHGDGSWVWREAC